MRGDAGCWVLQLGLGGRAGGHSVPTIGTPPFICREDDLYLRAGREVCWPGERQTDVSTCMVPPTLSSYGVRTFAAAGPRRWNSLPVQLRNPDITYGLFRRQLNGHLFLEARTRRSVTSDMRRHRKTLTYLHVFLYNCHRLKVYKFYFSSVLVQVKCLKVSCPSLLAHFAHL